MSEQKSMLDPIEEGIEAIGRGEIIIVVDDEDREMKVISFAQLRK